MIDCPSCQKKKPNTANRAMCFDCYRELLIEYKAILYPTAWNWYLEGRITREYYKQVVELNFMLQ